MTHRQVAQRALQRARLGPAAVVAAVLQDESAPGPIAALRDREALKCPRSRWRSATTMSRSCPWAMPFGAITRSCEATARQWTVGGATARPPAPRNIFCAMAPEPFEIMGIVNVTPGLVLRRRRVVRRATRRSRTACGSSREGADDPRRRRRVHAPAAPCRCREDEELRRVDAGRRGPRGARRRGSPSTRPSSRSPRRRSTPARPTSTTSPRSATTPELAGLVADRGARLLPDAHARRAADDAGRPALRRRRRRRQGVPRGARRVRRRARASREDRIAARPGHRLRQDARRTTSSCCARLDEIVALGLPRRDRRLAQVVHRHARPAARDPHDRVAGTIATNVLALERGARVFRVHDVARRATALKVAAATLAARWRLTRSPTTSSSPTTSTTTRTSRTTARPDRGDRSRSAACRSTRTTA